MKQFASISELSTTGANAKPVVVFITDNECWEIVSHLPGRDGYVQLKRNKKSPYSHRLSYEAFVGKVPEGLCVLHKCDNPPCINPKHLFTGTVKDNGQDMAQKGRSPRGEKCGMAKLTSTEVKTIRSLKGFVGTKKLSQMFQVSRVHINRILTAKRWNHLKGCANE